MQMWILVFKWIDKEVDGSSCVHSFVKFGRSIRRDKEEEAIHEIKIVGRVREILTKFWYRGLIKHYYLTMLDYISFLTIQSVVALPLTISRKWNYCILFVQLSQHSLYLSHSLSSFLFKCFCASRLHHGPLLSECLSLKVLFSMNATTPSTIPSSTKFDTHSLTLIMSVMCHWTIFLLMKLVKSLIPMDPYK